MAFKMSSFAETMALGYLKSQVMELTCVDGIILDSSKLYWMKESVAISSHRWWN